MTPELPVTAVRERFLAALALGPVVLSSPTGSGKSTEVPRWCAGRVLVIEPRRIACRSLASRVAQLEGTRLGETVGYVVRDEHVANRDTRIVFATPGMALRNRTLLESAQTIMLDEFHERSLETDLLLALLLRAASRSLVIMSATLDGDRIAQHVHGQHITAQGRAFPVDMRYLPSNDVLPSTTDLSLRVQRALQAARNDPGDVLVFLPGKAEIEACMQALAGDCTAVPLHGGLSLDEQRRAFEPTPRRKVVLATNVAETSLTIPGIGVVIDAGLVRQTRYHNGRGFLALVPIAEDSATQRAGRAGRMASGVCYRLWSSAAALHATTLPEIHRESLVPLLLFSAAWDAAIETLPLLDPPKAPALDAARGDLAAWGALTGSGQLSEIGRGLFSAPIGPEHAGLLVAAQREGCLHDMIDLVAVLAVSRPLFSANQSEVSVDDDLRAAGCDASAAIAAIRAHRPADHGVSTFVVREARQTRSRLRKQHGLSDTPAQPAPADRDALIRAAIAADSRRVHVARPRGRDVFFSNGGTEVELARESAVANVRNLEAIIVLDTRAFGVGRDARVLVTCAMAIPCTVIARAGLGEERLGAVKHERRSALATIERVYAKRVISEREEVPSGELARAAIATLIERGSVFKETIKLTRQRLARSAMAEQLALRGHPAFERPAQPVLAFEPWLHARLQTLGVESGADLALLSESDFLAADLPYLSSAALDAEYPATVNAGDAIYRADYDLAANQVLLHLVKGARGTLPQLAYLPRFPGLRICVEGPRGLHVLRERTAHA